MLNVLTYFASPKGLSCTYPILESLFVNLLDINDEAAFEAVFYSAVRNHKKWIVEIFIYRFDIPKARLNTWAVKILANRYSGNAGDTKNNEIIKLLIAKGADDWGIFLSEAIGKHNVELVKMCIKKTYPGYDTIKHAMFSNNEEILGIIIDHITEREKTFGWTLIISSTINNNSYQMTRYLANRAPAKEVDWEACKRAINEWTKRDIIDIINKKLNNMNRYYT